MSHWEAPGESDEWRTPSYIFDALGVTFDLDPCYPSEGPCFVPCRRQISRQGLETSWHGMVWLNPPFGGRNGLEPWLEKFFKHGCGVALVPDRTSAPWFQGAARKAHNILFVSPKIKFIRPDGSIGKSPGTGTALLAVGMEACVALHHARGRKLGWLCQNA